MEQRKTTTLTLLKGFVEDKLAYHAKLNSNQELILELNSVLNYLNTCNDIYQSELYLAKVMGKNELLVEMNEIKQSLKIEQNEIKQK